MELRGSNLPRRSSTRAQQRARGAWVFSLLLLAVMAVIVFLDRGHLSGVGQPVVAVLAGLLAGSMTFFLTGDLGVRLSWLRGTGGVAAFVVVLFLWPRLLQTQSPSLYHVRVSVITPQGEPAESVVLSSSLGGEWKRAGGGWELDVPAEDRPADHRPLRVYAHQGPGTATYKDIDLEADFHPVAEIKLPQPGGARVTGIVVDEHNMPIAGASVSVVGRKEIAITEISGAFSLPAGVPSGEVVVLRAVKRGYRPQEQPHPAGEGASTLQLDRQ